MVAMVYKVLYVIVINQLLRFVCNIEYNIGILWYCGVYEYTPQNDNQLHVAILRVEVAHMEYPWFIHHRWIIEI